MTSRPDKGYFVVWKSRTKGSGRGGFFEGSFSKSEAESLAKSHNKRNPQEFAWAIPRPRMPRVPAKPKPKEKF